MTSRILPVGLTALLLAGCGSGVSGTYNGGSDSLMKSMTFKDEGKVDIVLINGIGGEGTYEVDGDKVRVSANGNTNELTIDGDCLRGPLMVGTLCKNGATASASEPASGSGSPAGRGGDGLAGSTFEAAGGGGRMVFQFTDGRSVRVSSVAPGAPEGTGAVEGTYSISGDQVVIDIQGDPETFTLSGNTLTGNLGGDQVTFTRK